MPKKPKIETPLRKLRDITGKSQAAFATASGFSTSVIKKVERGDKTKLHISLLLFISQAFGVASDSILPHSTELIAIDGKPYTKEFYERWLKYLALRVPAEKDAMLRELELLSAAALRAPGTFNGFMSSFRLWLYEALERFQLEPHLAVELRERHNKIRQRPNKHKADWNLFQSFVENKPKFLQEAFEADIYMTPLVQGFVEKQKLNLPKDFYKKTKKIPKSKLLKIVGSAFSKYPTDTSKVFQEIAAKTSGPKRTR